MTLSPCELEILARRSNAERRFQQVRDNLVHDKRGVYRQLDLLGLEADLALSVRFKDGDWLELELDNKVADGGVRWVTYHAATVTDHAARIVIPTSCPALWWAAEHYLDRAISVFDAHRRRVAQ
jgi:hypothetical protein